MASSPPKEPDDQLRPPGNRIKGLASRSRVLREILTHTHVLQIIDDHQYEWLTAQDEEARRRIELRLRRQLALAGVNFVGFELTVHGAVAMVFTDPLHGGSLIAIGAAILYATAGKGHL